ncbi:13375_t:CDS:2, partial [Funneliformis geosporum]
GHIKAYQKKFALGERSVLKKLTLLYEKKEQALLNKEIIKGATLSRQLNVYQYLKLFQKLVNSAWANYAYGNTKPRSYGFNQQGRGYEAKDLEELFKRAGRIRKDCQTIASSFSKIESLGEIKNVLKQCTSETEFNSKKRDYLDTINQSISGLRPRTGYSSSMFGDIKQLNLEIKQIEAKMKENKRKAMSEKDPAKRAILLQMIEADGELLKQKYKERQTMENKFNFDPVKKVQDMVDAIRQAIERSNQGDGGNGGGSPNRPNRPNDPDNNDPFGGLGGDGNTDPDPNRLPRPRKPTLAIYYLTHENQDRKTQRQLKAEQAQEERLLRRMEVLKRLRDLLIALVLIGGLAYYFLGYLPEERQRAKEEIEQMFRDNWNAFKEKMLKAIERKATELEQEEIDKPRKMREEAVDNVKSACEKEELETPKIQKIIEKFTEKVNEAPLEKLDELKKKAKSLIEQERFKRQKLHWRREVHN